MTIQIYTDGSCMNQSQKNIGVWVAIVLIDGEEVRLHGVVPSTSQHSMELMAVIKAIEFLWESKKAELSIQIFTDSQYVFQLEGRKQSLVNNHFLTSKGVPVRNSVLVKHLFLLLENLPVQFIKVKGHQKKKDTLYYHREADLLSRKMARTYWKSIGQ